VNLLMADIRHSRAANWGALLADFSGNIGAYGASPWFSRAE
jgi:hypothetical protein